MNLEILLDSGERVCINSFVIIGKRVNVVVVCMVNIKVFVIL